MTQDFIRERQYLKAVSRSHTVIWYGCSFNAFEGAPIRGSDTGAHCSIAPA